MQSCKDVHSWAWVLYKEVRAQGYTCDIGPVDLYTAAGPTFDNMLKERYDALWQNLPVNPRKCPSEGASLYVYNAWFANMAS